MNTNYYIGQTVSYKGRNVVIREKVSKYLYVASFGFDTKGRDITGLVSLTPERVTVNLQ